MHMVKFLVKCFRIFDWKKMVLELSKKCSVFKLHIKKVKFSHTCYWALAAAKSWYPGSRLPLLFARPAVTFPAKEHHSPSTGTKLNCLVAETHRCEQLAQCCYADGHGDWWDSNPQPKWSQVQCVTSKPPAPPSYTLLCYILQDGELHEIC